MGISLYGFCGPANPRRGEFCSSVVGAPKSVLQNSPRLGLASAKLTSLGICFLHNTKNGWLDVSILDVISTALSSSWHSVSLTHPCSMSARFISGACTRRCPRLVRFIKALPRRAPLVALAQHPWRPIGALVIPTKTRGAVVAVEANITDCSERAGRCAEPLHAITALPAMPILTTGQRLETGHHIQQWLTPSPRTVIILFTEVAFGSCCPARAEEGARDVLAHCVTIPLLQATDA